MSLILLTSNQSKYFPVLSGKILSICFGSLLLTVGNHALADCAPTAGFGSREPNSTTQYASNNTVVCTGETIITPVIPPSNSGYGGTVSAETSTTVRWQHLTLKDDSVSITVEKGAKVTGEGLTKAMLLIHPAYYTSLGLGGESSIRGPYTPDNRVSYFIENNGELQYFNKLGIKDDDESITAAINIEGNDAPANQRITNTGSIYSEGSWGVITTGIGISLFGPIPLESYKFSSNNTILVENSKGATIEQTTGTIAAGSTYEGHSAAVGVYQAVADKVHVNNDGEIKGSYSGVDLVTTNLVKESVLNNTGLISGGKRGISVTPVKYSSSLTLKPYFQTINNKASGIISGASEAGIYTIGDIDEINNYGTIMGARSIDASAESAIDKSIGSIGNINNYGKLEGDVLLGKSRLNLMQSMDAIVGSPQVKGDIKGNADSQIYIQKNTQFNTSGNADVGHIFVEKGSRLNLADQASWKASGSRGILNEGEIGLGANAIAAELMGSVQNRGLFDIGCSSSACMSQTVNVVGDYEGAAGAALSLHTALAGDASPTDKLVITGKASGTTAVKVINKGGAGDQTMKGIKIIETGASDADAFVQSGRIVAGAYDYRLQQGDSAGTDANNWYLVSHLDGSLTPDTPMYRPEIGSALANTEAANALFHMRLHDRMGDARYAEQPGRQSSMWIRATGSRSKFHQDNSLNTTSNKYVLQLGKDLLGGATNGQDNWRVGAMVGYGNASSDTNSALTSIRSNGDLHGYSLGVYGTWFENKDLLTGGYIDSWLIFNRFNSKISGQGLVNNKYVQKGLAASIEGGYAQKVSESDNYDYWLMPQAQVIWSNIKFNDFSDGAGTVFKQEGSASTMLRLGLRGYINKKHLSENQAFKSFAEVNWIHNTNGYGISLDGETFNPVSNKNIGEFKLGVEGQLSANTSGWVSLARQWGKDRYSDVKLVIGVKHSF